MAIRRALISVYDKTGIVDFARSLHGEFGVEIISTGGTARTLSEAGIPVTLVEDITGFPEMLDGRVKTLHPRIHAAILADRDNPEHMRQLAEQGIDPIDMVVVNLYPFEKTIAKAGCSFEEAIEMIDIGGPCLLRAAAKNHKHVLVEDNPEQYDNLLRVLRGEYILPENDRDDRRYRAALAFGGISMYDAPISEWIGKQKGLTHIPWLTSIFSRNWGTLRYGENPHQRAELLESFGDSPFCLPTSDACWEDNADISFNNYADASAALELCAELTRSGSAKLCFAQAERGSERRFAPIRDEETSRRKLPHWQKPGATYWITYTSAIGVLSEAERDIALASLRHWDGNKIDLYAAVVMPDHVHALLAPREIPGQPGTYANLSALLKSIKGFSGREISTMRGGIGQVWTRESFDRWIRNEADFEEKWKYIAENPVKEGLASVAGDYRWWHGVDVFGLGIGQPVPADSQAELGSSDPVPCDVESADATGDSDKSHTNKAELCSPRACCFIKHTNACGTAVDADPIEAYRRAYLGDPNAAMGGVLAVNFKVDAAFAAAVMETYQRWGKPLKEAGHPAPPGAFFLEVWVAESFDEEAVRIIRGEKEGGPQKAWGKRVRLLDVGDMLAEPDADEMDIKRIAGGVLMQTRDLLGLNEDQWKVVSKRTPTEAEMDDLRLAWLVCKHTKSNAISICKDGALIGNGAGQMSRVMSCRIATWLATENGHADALKGAVAASDAFFPFRDGPEILIDAGVSALIQPGGSKRDGDTISACDERDVAMVFTGTRHFKH